MGSRSSGNRLMELCANESIATAPLARSNSTTWSFVQMNMTLLPIARPLPVIVSHRLLEGAAASGVQPCTPTQKLHHRLRERTTNISPRQHDLNHSDVRSAAMTSSDLSSSSGGLPPTPTPAYGAKRKFLETWHVPVIDTVTPLSVVSTSLRMRSYSEDLYLPAPRSDNGHSSDPMRETTPECSPLHRSTSLASGCATTGLCKGKRILELQDEYRRFRPEDHETAPSPSKRSKHQS